jgi:uncharacterized protein (TIGR02611 family)
VTQREAELAWNLRFRGWFRRHWLLDTAWRITVFVVGVTLMCLGVVLLVLPGPGWAMIALGLIVLASEYVWAQKLLAPVRSRLQAAKAKAQQPQYRNQVRAASAAMIVLLGAAVGAYLWRYGISLDGVRGLWPL